MRSARLTVAGSRKQTKQGRTGMLAKAVACAIEALEGRVLLAGDVYVDIASPGPTHDGSSWADAFVDLQLALAAATSGDSILVAEGTYTPTATTDRTISFVLEDGVSVLGGYAGYGASNPDARDVALYPTILSGDIGAVGDNSDNSYHVLVGGGTDATAVLDGFTITAGNADGGSPEDSGGGMYNVWSSPTLSNDAFSRNYAASYGGGMYNDHSSPTLSNSTFNWNWAYGAYGSGGGMYNGRSSPTLNNCTFNWNSAPDGGGMTNGSSSPTLSNCTFSANSAYGTYGQGGGMLNYSSSPALSNCTFSGNSAYGTYGQGGGMCNNRSSSPTLSNCTFSGNSAYGTYGSGGGMSNMNSSSATLSNCTFSGNYASYGGGMWNWKSSPTLTNCTFSGNYSSYGGGMLNGSSSPTLTNCTFSGNSASTGGGMWNNDSSSPTLTNCIIWGSSSAPIYNDSSSNSLITYSDIQGGYPGTGNIDADPLFVRNPSGSDYGDLRLRFGSPCTDAGNNAAPGLVGVSTDITGGPRIINGTVDMGAYESGAEDVYVDIASPGPTHDGSSWADAFVDLQLALAAATSGDSILVAEGTYTPTATTDRTISFVLEDGVSVLGGYAGYGASNPDARDVALYPTILSGDIGAVGNNSDNSYHVLMGGGTDGTAVLDGFTITAGNANGASPDDSGGGMNNVWSSPTLSNDTFSRNYAASYGGGMYNDHSSPTLSNSAFNWNWAYGAYGSGGGMYNGRSSPTLSNCAFNWNSASDGGGGMLNVNSSSPTLSNCAFSGNSVYGTYGGGGGMQNYSSSPTLSNCAFSGNSVYGTYGKGGGMWNNRSSSPTLSNCTFSGNSAYGTYGSGGGMSNWYSSSPKLSNCTFSGNYASYGGAMDNYSSTPTLTNCIIWGSSSSPIYNDSSSNPVITYSDIQGGYPGTGNIDADPLFVRNPSGSDYGDLRLRFGSPCIDAGNNNAPGLAGITTDLAGHARFADVSAIDDTGSGTAPIVDMGAYELTMDIALSANAVAENQPVGTVVGSLSTIDPDTDGTCTYSLVTGTGDADNASFTISGDQLKAAAVFDSESKSSYSIRIRTTDAGGLWYDKVFVIGVQEYFTDSNLETAIRAELIYEGYTPGPTLMLADMLDLTWLNAPYDNITSLDGLQDATNLQRLYLSDNAITDLTPLAGLNLTELDVSDNSDLTDLSPLAGLNLHGLDVSGDSALTDLSPVAGMTNLTQLDIENTDVSNIAALAGLTNLIVLYAGSAPITSVAPLVDLTSLQELDLSYTSVADVSPLAGLSSVQNLDLTSTSVTNLSPLSGLTSLTGLTLSNTSPTSLAPLQSLSSLEALNLSYCGITNAKLAAVDWSSLPLTWLVLDGNPISDLTPISGITSLTGLSINGDAQLTAFPSLAALTLLTSLSANGGYLPAGHGILTDISGLSGLYSLQNLDVNNNQITSIAPLAGLTAMVNLNIAGNQISDVSAISGMTKLQWLNAGYNQITTLTDVNWANLPNLTQGSFFFDRLASWPEGADAPILAMLYARGFYSDEVQTVVFADANFSAAVHTATHTPAGQVVDSDQIAGMTSLDLSNTPITSLQGIEYATGLKTLSILNTGLNLAPGTPDRARVDLLISRGVAVQWGVYFADPNLEAAVRQALTKEGHVPGATITPADMLNLTDLVAPGAGINNLTGLEYATNLQYLDLSYNQISDITPLAELTQLTTLDLSHNLISDVAPLTGSLSLAGMSVLSEQSGDVMPLDGSAPFAQLTWLDLSFNRISDITPLAELTQLTWVDVDNNNLNLTPGSPSMLVIQGWIGQGADVTYEEQNDAPTDIALSSSSIAENQPSGTAVGTLSTADPDVGNTFTYSLVSGTGSTDNASFTISSSTLQTAAIFDYETKNSYSIRIRTTDQGGLWFEKVFTISVLNVAEVVPTITGISTDSGISSTDGITSDRTLLINGTSEPGMTITVYRGGVLTGTTSANGSGNWLFDYTGTSLADGSYNFTATASDTLGDTTAASSAYAVTIDTTAPALPTLSINDGAAQRSMVRKMTLSFGEKVVLDAGAVTLKMNGGSAVANTTLLVSNPSGDKMSYVLSFSGTAVVGGSLADGIYDLAVAAAGVHDLAGNGMAGSFSQRFHRLYGDYDGNGTVNNADYYWFKQTFGKSSGDTGFLDLFDYDNNRTINNGDYYWFKQRFGIVYSY